MDGTGPRPRRCRSGAEGGVRLPAARSGTRQRGCGPAWDGDRTVRLYATCQTGSAYALLLERCRPGIPLGQVLPAPEQYEVLALGRMGSTPPGPRSSWAAFVRCPGGAGHRSGCVCRSHGYSHRLPVRRRLRSGVILGGRAGLCHGEGRERRRRRCPRTTKISSADPGLSTARLTPGCGALAGSARQAPGLSILRALAAGHLRNGSRGCSPTQR